jgi:hemolysin-activating ACP:hemolysin acyltransferase
MKTIRLILIVLMLGTLASCEKESYQPQQQEETVVNYKGAKEVRVVEPALELCCYYTYTDEKGHIYNFKCWAYKGNCEACAEKCFMWEKLYGGLQKQEKQ